MRSMRTVDQPSVDGQAIGGIESIGWVPGDRFRRLDPGSRSRSLSRFGAEVRGGTQRDLRPDHRESRVNASATLRWSRARAVMRSSSGVTLRAKPSADSESWRY